MKKFVTLSALSGLFLFGNALAFSPIPGFYIGALADLAHGPNTRTGFTVNNITYPARINYEPVGGGGGLTVGYRIKQFRVEGELLYNYMAADTLQVGDCTLQSPTLAVPNASCPAPSPFRLFGFNGSLSGFYGFANVYYDFMRDSFDVSVVPYIGVGIGSTKLTERLNFVFQNGLTSFGESFTGSSGAGQLIGGLNLFIDDYTWVGMDLRYITTNGLSNVENSRYGVIALNFLVNFALDKGYPK